MTRLAILYFIIVSAIILILCGVLNAKQGVSLVFLAESVFMLTAPWQHYNIFGLALAFLLSISGIFLLIYS